MYNGKENLRGEGETYEMTPELIADYFKCAEDIVYFAEKYFYIVSINKGKHIVELYDFQKKALNVFTKKEVNGRPHCIILFPRQMGKCLFSNSTVKVRKKGHFDEKYLKITELFENKPTF